MNNKSRVNWYSNLLSVAPRPTLNNTIFPLFLFFLTLDVWFYKEVWMNRQNVLPTFFLPKEWYDNIIYNTNKLLTDTVTQCLQKIKLFSLYRYFPHGKSPSSFSTILSHFRLINKVNQWFFVYAHCQK